ncbi:MAG: hypothetical protein KJO75_06895 [Dactylosporangium sp.]|nr:hypothetical protein [Dactylosporangium sp.]
MRDPLDPITMGATIMAALLLLVIAVAWPRHDPMAEGLTLAAICLVPLGLAIGVCQARKRQYSLWAEYHGGTVRLLRVPRCEVHGQICRALIRAREAADRTRRIVVTERVQRNSSADLLMRSADSSGHKDLSRMRLNALR